MHDPLLTPYGEEQCRHLARVFPYHSKIDLLVASPLRRTIYTCLHGFESETRRGLKIITLPEAQETADVPCDTGSDPEKLKAEFADKPVEFSLVKDGWNSKTGKWAGEPKALAARAKEVREWLKQRPEKEIVVVTHGGILHYITEDWNDFNKAWGTGWANTEFRSYEFKHPADDSTTLVETQASRKLRSGTEQPLTETERLALARTDSLGSNGHIPSKV